MQLCLFVFVDVSLQGAKPEQWLSLWNSFHEAQSFRDRDSLAHVHTMRNIEILCKPVSEMQLIRLIDTTCRVIERYQII